MLKVVVRLYESFDTLFSNEELAQDNLVGWEHKESVKVKYVGIDLDSVNEYNFYNGVQSEEFNGWLFDSEEMAEQEVEAYNQM